MLQSMGSQSVRGLTTEQLNWVHTHSHTHTHVHTHTHTRTPQLSTMRALVQGRAVYPTSCPPPKELSHPRLHLHLGEGLGQTYMSGFPFALPLSVDPEPIHTSDLHRPAWPPLVTLGMVGRAPGRCLVISDAPRQLGEGALWPLDLRGKGNLT